jgi:hypothetical protein
MKAMKPFPKEFVGKWQHVSPWNGDDYLAEYTVSLRGGRPAVSGFDLSDGEAFKISGVSWDGKFLRFQSKMPSTGRIGVNEFKLKKDGSIQSRFTFTVVEEMKRADTQQAAARDRVKKRGA